MSNIDQALEDVEELSIQLQTMGFMDLSHYEDCKHETSEGLIKFGNTFLNKLGHTLADADIKNGIRILRLWYNECQQHQMLYKQFLAKEAAIAFAEAQNFRPGDEIK